MGRRREWLQGWRFVQLCWSLAAHTLMLPLVRPALPTVCCCCCCCSGEKKELEARCEQIRQSMETTTSDYDREKLQERLAKLSGGWGCTFFLGGGGEKLPAPVYVFVEGVGRLP